MSFFFWGGGCKNTSGGVIGVSMGRNQTVDNSHTTTSLGKPYFLLFPLTHCLVEKKGLGFPTSRIVGRKRVVEGCYILQLPKGIQNPEILALSLEKGNPINKRHPKNWRCFAMACGKHSLPPIQPIAPKLVGHMSHERKTYPMHSDSKLVYINGNKNLVLFYPHLFRCTEIFYPTI